MEPTWNSSRKEAKEYALAHGKFWLRCPYCRLMFGGHESGSTSFWSALDVRTGRAVCCKEVCQAKARWSEAKYMWAKYR